MYKGYINKDMKNFIYWGMTVISIYIFIGDRYNAGYSNVDLLWGFRLLPLIELPSCSSNPIPTNKGDIDKVLKDGKDLGIILALLGLPTCTVDSANTDEKVWLLEDKSRIIYDRRSNKVVYIPNGNDKE